MDRCGVGVLAHPAGDFARIRCRRTLVHCGTAGASAAEPKEARHSWHGSCTPQLQAAVPQRTAVRFDQASIPREAEMDQWGQGGRVLKMQDPPARAQARLLSQRNRVVEELLASEHAAGEPLEGWQQRRCNEQVAVADYSYREVLLRQLHEVNEALDRIAAGKYGRCTLCQAEMGHQRLATDPAASLCLACQIASEVETLLPSL